jgi:hypothetical protein
MTNNIELIKSLLNFESSDDFYHCQIIKRKKEHPELGSNSYMVKTYFIKSFEDLDKDFEEMKCLVNFHNARVMINLNKRSFEKLAFQNLKKVTDQILNKDYISVRKSYITVCGQFSSDTDKKWIIDIDTKDDLFIKKISEYISNIYPVEDRIKSLIPTKNGFHLITKPFNVMEFKNTFPELEIHKDNPTILFIP